MVRYGWGVLLLVRFLITGTVQAQPVKLLPASQVDRLLHALTQYKNIAEAGTWATFPEDICLKPGETNPHILKLRNNL